MFMRPFKIAGSMVVDIELALGNRAISDDEVGSLDNPTEKIT
jgi:hypothetical protein